MPDRKRRVKTGCLSCRQRRVKCDERRPICQRCEIANISCEGYQPARRLPPKRPEKKQGGSNGNDIASRVHVDVDDERLDHPLFNFPNDSETSRIPHQRGREILGQMQYAHRTAKLLFREDQLYFWRDYLSGCAMGAEYVYDAITAIGLMHRAALMLSDGQLRSQGLDYKVAAYQVYANTLTRLHDVCIQAPEAQPEILIAVLLILTYFECFAGNHTAAFQHLRTAQSHLDEANLPGLLHSAALEACIGELGLVVQVVLPLPLIGFPLIKTLTAVDSVPAPCTFKGARNSSQDLAALIELLCSYKRINVGVWCFLSNTEETLDPYALAGFQASILYWRSQSGSTFDRCDENQHITKHTDLEDLSIPPKAKSFRSLEAALGAAVFHCYMGRSDCLISTAMGGNEQREKSAQLHAYHILCIAEGIQQELEKSLNDRSYLPCNAIKMGLIPLLFMASQFCYDASWVEFIIEKLGSLGQEGLYNGTHFARALQVLPLFQSQAKKLESKQSATAKPRTSPPSLRFNVVPMLFPGTEEDKAVAYYIRALKHNQVDRTQGRRNVVQVVGRVRWEKSTDGTSTTAAMDFFDPGHAINQGLNDRCMYLQIARNEPIALEWETLLGTDALGRYGYFVHLAAERDALIERVQSGVDDRQLIDKINGVPPSTSMAPT
ncbi:hypothetical protein BT63DRAFT_454397 [Microthyrium microscopicum]|uniref:Zn(2)-C6 fungal-type domain-containing protein n=1 Tax=Microthyrium microscopicum TaxID=703497 RepID=A0A6A6UD73_9PEZI|nr:hypothetical protein BT63DRAFT_454397 [Microthyrium microscopicum]